MTEDDRRTAPEIVEPAFADVERFVEVISKILRSGGWLEGGS